MFLLGYLFFLFWERKTTFNSMTIFLTEIFILSQNVAKYLTLALATACVIVGNVHFTIKQSWF